MSVMCTVIVRFALARRQQQAHPDAARPGQDAARLPGGGAARQAALRGRAAAHRAARGPRVRRPYDARAHG